MGNEKCLIPSKISVGFQERSGTYTGKLAYVVYYDLKGVRRKEKSWESWRDKKIPIMEFTNEPTDGFVLNKGVGGARESYGYNARNEYIRVYDPRNFEFEISVANLLFILQECNSYKGKGLEGKFVYSWQGTELVLLPAGCEDYKKSALHTDMQSMGVKVKELVPGAYYTTKKNVDVIYIGKFTQYDLFMEGSKYRYGRQLKPAPPPQPKHTFWDVKDETWIFTKDLKFLARRNGDAIAENFAELSVNYASSMHASKASRLELRPIAHYRKYEHNPTVHWNYESKGLFCQRSSHFHSNTPAADAPPAYVYELSSYVITPEGAIKANYKGDVHYDPASPDSVRRTLPSSNTWIRPTNLELWAIMESGREYIIRDETLIDPATLKPLNTIESHG